LLGILVAAGSGRFITALLIALLLDVTYGAPPGGIAGAVVVPCTLFALLCIAGRLLANRYFFNKRIETL
jgi:hypothetical protein